ncbi:MAG: hypothetical protein ACLQU5_31605 [Isosphaeraceae bacterium]
MERVAFLLHGTFEGKKAIDIFVCGRAAMSEEEKKALVRQVEDSNGQRFRTRHKTRR